MTEPQNAIKDRVNISVTWVLDGKPMHIQRDLCLSKEHAVANKARAHLRKDCARETAQELYT